MSPLNMLKRIAKYALVAGAIILLWWSAANWVDQAEPDRKPSPAAKKTPKDPVPSKRAAPKPYDDLRSRSYPLGEFPDSINKSSPETKQAYMFASNVANHKVLKALRCYCGCEQTQKHQSLLDCYITKLAPKDRVFYSSHALSCRSCVTEVLNTERMLSEGKSLEEIRAAIDRDYGP